MGEDGEMDGWNERGAEMERGIRDGEREGGRRREIILNAFQLFST